MASFLPVNRLSAICAKAVQCLNARVLPHQPDRTEYNRMISGMPYNAGDAYLSSLRLDCRRLLDLINSSTIDIKGGKRSDLLKDLFGSIGDGLWLQPPFYCDYGKNISLGSNVYFNFNCTILDVAKVTIGSSVFFGPGVQIYTATHPTDWQRRSTGEESGKPVTINSNVWIGGGVIILPGITIGEKSTIGAGSVVTKDVPSGSIIAGNPARTIKNI